MNLIKRIERHGVVRLQTAVGANLIKRIESKYLAGQPKKIKILNLIKRIESYKLQLFQFVPMLTNLIKRIESRKYIAEQVIFS